MNKQTVVQSYNEILVIKRNYSHMQHDYYLNCITLSERSLFQKATYCLIPFMWRSRKGRKIRREERATGLMLRKGWGMMCSRGVV